MSFFLEYILFSLLITLDEFILNKIWNLLKNAGLQERSMIDLNKLLKINLI